jgi:hypothetical protein
MMNRIGAVRTVDLAESKHFGLDPHPTIAGGRAVSDPVHIPQAS